MRGQTAELFARRHGRASFHARDDHSLADAGKSVFCLCCRGGGTGAPVFRRLQREGIPFAAGVLWENDLDYPVAKALAAKVVSLPAFGMWTEEAARRAEALIDASGRTLRTLPMEQMTGQAAPLRALLTYAGEQGKWEGPHGL